MSSSWADAVADAPPVDARVRRTSRPNYVPPPIRNRSPQPPPGYRRGPVRGRGKRGVGGPREPNAFEPPDRMGDLSLAEKDEAEEASGGAGINFDAYEDIPVDVSGSDVPPPARAFDDIDLGEALRLNIQRCGYVRPTPIQRHAIPILMAGRDLMACAQTGSGKTAAFCFPMISGVMRSLPPPLRGARGRGGQGTACPIALVLSPTRELAGQIHHEARKFAYETGVRLVVAYGGVPMYQQMRDLERGADILVATPGRLVDLVERDKVVLHNIRYLALDEADRMLDMGFEPQIRRIIEAMGVPKPGERQTMLFSATFPQEIQCLASDFLSNYIFLAVGRVGSSTGLILQRVEYVDYMDKKSRLMNLLHGQTAADARHMLPLTLVFVETKREADSLERWLSVNGFHATSIHGDRTQREREHALRSFKSGSAPIMVATDVAARGLDVPNVAHVINFDLPRDIDDYVHRIGRTGRAGKSGLATAFFTDDDQPLAKALTNIMRESSQEVPDWLLQFTERPSYGGKSRRHGGGRFGGYDYRRDAPAWEDNHDSRFYRVSAEGPKYISEGYDFGIEKIPASGWD